MGKISRTILGGPEQGKGSTGNHAYDSINSSFSPNFGFTSSAGNAMSNLLGLGGGPAQTDALENFSSSGGMDFLREQGQKAITSSKAASGLLNSGSYGTALEKYGQGLASTYLNQYMSNLGNLGNLGLSSGALVSDAGKYSTQKSEGKKEGLLPMILSAIPTPMPIPA